MAVRFGRRVRKGAAGTAVAAMAMAALTASQAPGLAAGVTHTSAVSPPGTGIDGGSAPYITDLPPLNSPTKPGSPGTQPGTGVIVTPGGAGIPATVLAAYKNAEATLRGTEPGCGLPWQLLAGIGQVESGQADNGDVDAQGTTLRPIYGPELDGNGFALIPDTDGGRYDGDARYDRAVGPMQFIPSTWESWGADGNHDGKKDPNNVFDAALAAGDYLCAVGGDLTTTAGVEKAILGYNHSDAYLASVMSWFQYFRDGTHEIPDDPRGGAGSGPGLLPSATPSPSASPSHGAAPGHSPSPSRSPRPTASASGSIGPAPTKSPKPKPSPTGTCASGSPSPSPSGSGSASPSPSPSPSGSASGSPSPSPSGSSSASPSPSGSPSPSPSGTCTPTPSPSRG
ncbi:lytic transglycosylase domain-containing protein [Streptomyces sp. ICBB 8177]|uniref:lytic transglycosylase domain-containing protein n=1 Tax=Streptomyces sp. ICBB 8177 TaxID=563922 RepID=UPI000D682ADD|nr:lytic transglycosylase domain-containing protein [Streptomyces sp. ICBB 8177]PWI43482.1 hypothetical protein CK485_15215 [Streptomyces sp. ICBB 8177]